MMRELNVTLCFYQSKKYENNPFIPSKKRESSVDLQKHNIKDTGGRSRKKHEDTLEVMYEEVGDSGRGERGMKTP